MMHVYCQCSTSILERRHHAKHDATHTNTHRPANGLCDASAICQLVTAFCRVTLWAARIAGSGNFDRIVKLTAVHNRYTANEVMRITMSYFGKTR